MILFRKRSNNGLSESAQYPTVLHVFLTFLVLFNINFSYISLYKVKDEDFQLDFGRIDPVGGSRVGYFTNRRGHRLFTRSWVVGKRDTQLALMAIHCGGQWGYLPLVPAKACH